MYFLRTWYLQLKTFLSFIVGVILSFKNLIDEALNTQLEERIPFLYSTISDVHEHSLPDQSMLNFLTNWIPYLCNAFKVKRISHQFVKSIFYDLVKPFRSKIPQFLRKNAIWYGIHVVIYTNVLICLMPKRVSRFLFVYINLGQKLCKI